ncbi:MAG: hypothetical protein FJ098_02850 [Deltaproteobacteria bacterium]|nr:hypothetical protein [Deltaproteobacteria bacterium]
MGHRVPIALLLVTACTGPAPEGGGDLIYLDVPWSFGRDGDANTGPADVDPSEDAPAGRDTTTPFDLPADPDALIAGDVPPGQDAPPAGDVSPPDDTPPPPDLQPADTGPCGGCPPERPNCVADVCLCTPFSCTGGTYCSGGDCVPCAVDAHCGPGCASCPSQGQVCAADGSHCLDCDAAHPCGPGKQCVDEACVACGSLGLCGPLCVPCPPQTPDCVDGACACHATSCPPEQACDSGACIPCTASDPLHCGSACAVCGGAKPHCLSGACALCNTAQACGPSCQPCGGALSWCPPDGSGCVECFDDAHCPAGFHCTAALVCLEDCSAQGCASDATPTGKKCGQARVAGRIPASAPAGVVFTGDTWSADNEDDLSQGWFPPAKCTDEGEDNYVRIWLRPGDTLTVDLDVQDPWCDAMLKLYTGTECDKDDAGIFEDNDDFLIDCWDEGWDGDDETFTWTSTGEGWHTVVVDGRDAYDPGQWPDEGDSGPYAITLKLACAEAGCCCP